LLGEAGLGAEVGAAKVGDLSGFPTVEPVATRHGFDYPGVHGKCFQAAGAEEEHAIGDFFADAGEGEQEDLGLGVGGALGGVEPTGVLGEKGRDTGDVAGAKTKGAGA